MSVPFSQIPFILLCCQGRSGSTLLLRHLNSIDGYHITGESSGGIQYLLHFYQKIKNTNIVRNKPKEEEHYHLAYANSFDLNKITDEIYKIINNLVWKPEKKVLGFKEITFGFEQHGHASIYETFENEINLLKELFPNLKIIFLTRNINELIKSAWWALDINNAKEILLTQENNFKKFHEDAICNLSDTVKAFTFHITYAELCEESETFLRLFDFLEEEYNEKRFLEVRKKVTK